MPYIARGKRIVKVLFSHWCTKHVLWIIIRGSTANNPVSILCKSIAGRDRPVRVADGPIMAHYIFIKNVSWEKLSSATAPLARSQYLLLEIKLDTLYIFKAGYPIFMKTYYTSKSLKSRDP